MKRWPQGYLTDNEWQELLGLEYTLTHYPRYYNIYDYQIAENRLLKLRELKDDLEAWEKHTVKVENQ